MPKGIINITRFGGMITNPQSEDIPDENAMWCKNTDPQSESGVLKGMPTKGTEYTANSSHIPDVCESDWLQYERSSVTLTVDDVTDNGVHPIVISFASGHNLVAGDKIVVASVGGNTNANGTFRIASVTKLTITLPDPPIGNGNYTSGGTVTYVGGSKYDLIYADKDDNDITAIEDFYADEGYRTLLDIDTSPTPYCVKTFNKQAQVGCGSSYDARAVYRLISNKSFFNNAETVLSGLQGEYGYCYNAGSGAGDVAVITVGDTGASGYFQSGILYRWAVTYVYDGIQESNIAGYLDDSDLTDREYHTITVKVYGVNTSGAGSMAALDSRITAVNLYRTESSDDQAAHLGLYRLVTTININTGVTDANGVATNWASATDDYTIEFKDYGDYIGGGATYEEETGMPETLSRQSVRYKMNEVGGGYHWATLGNPTGQGGDWDRYIFRSQKYRPDMFNWVGGNHVVLPELPTALKWYNNYLYAFSLNKTYKINPELLFIEDVFDGAGCSNRQAVTVTEFGMFFCNLNNAYAMMDNQIITIGDTITESPRTSGTFGWKNFAYQTLVTRASRFVVLYEAYKRMVLFIGVLPNTTTINAFAFYLPLKEWSIQGIGALTWIANYGAFTGKDGEVYISTETEYLTRCFAGDSYETTTWISKEFNLNEPSQNKSWAKLKWDNSSGTPAVTYQTNGTDVVTSGLTATNDAYINTYAKTFQLLTQTTTTGKLDSIDILVRPLDGKR
jgi:hypothetical protein